MPNTVQEAKCYLDNQLDMETIPKNVLMDSLQNMPDQVDVEQVIEQIILLSKIERSKRQIENGESYTHQEVKESYRKWLE